MPLPFASQDLDLRFIALLTSVVLALAAIFAALVLKLTGPWPIDPNINVWWLYKAVFSLGSTAIVAMWCFYMAVLGIIFGYRRTDMGDWALVASFTLAAGYYMMVVIASASPWRGVFQAVM